MNVRLDGIYQEITKEKSWDYIRFYKDGDALTGATIDGPEESAEWLRKSNIGNGYVSKGVYTVEGNQISFSTKDDVPIDYHGLIEKEYLDLSIYSHITKNKSKRKYRFIEIENLIDRSSEPIEDREGKVLNYDGEWEEPFLYFKHLSKGDTVKEYPFGKFGTLYLIYSKNDKSLIKRLDEYWPTLENKIVKDLEKLITFYDRLGHLKVKYFQAFGNSTEYDEEVFHGTDSNLRLSFNLLESPTWDYFIQDNKIIHSQAAF